MQAILSFCNSKQYEDDAINLDYLPLPHLILSQALLSSHS